MYANELEFGWCWLPFFMMKSLSSHIGKILKYSNLNASPVNRRSEPLRSKAKEKFVDDQIFNFDSL